MFCLKCLFPPAQEMANLFSASPSLSLFLFFSSLSHLADCSLSATFSSSASSSPAFLLIFLSYTVISSSTSMPPSPWCHSSWHSLSHHPSEESQISFSASQFAVYFCCLSCLLSPFFKKKICLQGFFLLWRHIALYIQGANNIPSGPVPRATPQGRQWETGLSCCKSTLMSEWCAFAGQKPSLNQNQHWCIFRKLLTMLN